MNTDSDFSSMPGERKNVVLYYVLVFGVAWAVWLPLLFAAWGWINLALPAMWVYLAGLAPIGAGVWLTWRERGRTGLKQLARRTMMVNFSIKWYALALILPFAASLITAWVYGAGGGELRAAPIADWVPRYLHTLAVLTPLALFEEAGWRGYLSPRLQHTLGKLPSSVLMGSIWALWHFPYWLMPGNLLGGLPIGQTLVGMLAMIAGVAAFETQMTWLFNKTRGSLFFACFFHAAANATFMAAVLSPTASGVTTMVISAGAGWLIVAALYGYDAQRNKRNTTEALRAQRKHEVVSASL